MTDPNAAPDLAGDPRPAEPHGMGPEADAAVTQVRLPTFGGRQLSWLTREELEQAYATVVGSYDSLLRRPCLGCGLTRGQALMRQQPDETPATTLADVRARQQAE